MATLEKRRDALRNSLPVREDWRVVDARVEDKDVRLFIEHVRGSEPSIEIRFTWEVMADYLFEDESAEVSKHGRAILWQLGREHVAPKATSTLIDFNSGYAEKLLQEIGGQ